MADSGDDGAVPQVHKRRVSDRDDLALVVSSAKRQKTQDDGNKGQTAGNEVTTLSLAPKPIRSSSLASPIMLLAGHASEVNSCKFSPSGSQLVSASKDEDIFVWNTYGDCENTHIVRGHKKSVQDVHWTVDGAQLVSGSVDLTVGLWDAETGRRIRKLAEHEKIIHSVCPSKRGEEMIISGGDDDFVKIWDTRQKRSVFTVDVAALATGVSWSLDGAQYYTAGIDGTLLVWESRMNEVAYSLQGHTEAITSLTLSADGAFVLTNSLDNSLRIWDVRPFAAAQRCTKVLQGHTNGFEQRLSKGGWSADGSQVAVGSADGCVYIWDVDTGALSYQLPGHNGTVTEACFHPAEPIIASCAVDSNIYVGELAKQ